MITTTDFEEIYIAARTKENRLYTDAQVASLPVVEQTHIHYREWEIRKRSAEKLFSRLQQKNKSLNILEVGCGNGWFSAMLAGMDKAMVTGADINQTELEQAKRVFGNKKNLDFLPDDIREIELEENRFDVIIFAASIQYFESVEAIIQAALLLLNMDGEIHILDSHFYKEPEVEAAAARTLSYYSSLGHEEMADHYYHHAIGSMKKFNHTFLFDPASLKNKLFKRTGPFPWICIKHDNHPVII